MEPNVAREPRSAPAQATAAQEPAQAKAAVSAPARVEAKAKAATGSSGPHRLVVSSIALLLLVNTIGLSYYGAPLAVKVRHPFNEWLRPSGYVGQTLGLLSLLFFLFLWAYPIRKKYSSRLAFTGRISAWLDWHVASGLIVPWAAATHAGWRFTGLIGLGYAAMFIVYLSGLVGRYLYSRIPRQKTGVEMSRDEVAAEREQLLFELVATTGLPPSKVRDLLNLDGQEGSGLGLLGTARALIADDIARRKAVQELASRVKQSQDGTRALDRAALERVLLLARREIALSQQIRMLGATQRVFGLWHALHKPVAVTAFLAVAAHVVVAVAVGATWFH